MLLCNVMTDNKQIEKLKQDIYSEDWKIRWDAMLQLSSVDGDDIFNFFVSLLDSNNANTRNIGANGLMHMEDNRALQPLLKAIFKPENNKNVASLVSALHFIDCRHILKELDRKSVV